MSEQVRLIPGRKPADIITGAFAEHAPSKAFVLFSGGKDSSVTLDYCWRNHRELLTGALHINTGIGIPSTRNFAEQFCRDRDIPYFEARAPISYEDLVRKYGFPGPSAHRYMYVWLKERALDAFVAFHKAGRNDRIALITGVRAEESRRRMGTTLDIRRDGAQVWIAPLIDWSDADMMRHRTTYEVPMSPSSRELHISGECLCGAFGDPSELILIEGLYPEVGARIRALECEMREKGAPRCKWATALANDPEPSDEAPGPMCVGCYKQAALFTDESAA